MLYNLTTEEFNKRLRHNVRTLKRHMKTNMFCASEYHFVDHKKDKNDFMVSRRFFDIVAATIIGALPVDSMSGVDCFRLNKKGKMEAVELKLVELHTRGLFKSSSGSLYYGPEPTSDKRKRTSFRSKFKAHFEVFDDKFERNITTVLVMFDSENTRVIDALELNKDQIIKYLSNTMNSSGVIIKEKTSRKRTIAMSVFLKHGNRTNTEVRVFGFEKWENSLRITNIPIIQK